MPGTSAFPRYVLCARITTLRAALDVLGLQAAIDGQGAYECLGPMERELGELESRLRAADDATEPQSSQAAVA